MPNFYEDNDDLRFYVEKGLDWAPLVGLTEYEWRAADGPESLEQALELYGDVFTLVGEYAAEAIAPVARTVDTEKLRIENGEVVHPEAFDALFEGMRDMELYGMCLPRELGGMNLPFLAYNVTIELIARADVSVVAHYGFHGGIAMALLLYSVMEGTTEFDVENARISSTRFGDAIEEIRQGLTWGSMDITESDAGSDMGALRTTAEQDDDGAWYVTGQKIYITSGHGKYHIVIARTEPVAKADDPFGGLAGLSLFLVPAYAGTAAEPQRTVSTIDGIETKLGHNGSATVAISFERAPAELIGKRGEGFKMMLLLMNNARVGVGFESLGLCEAAYRMAREYASQRPSMGKTIDRHEMIADYLDEMRTDCQAIRAIAMAGGFAEEMAQKLRLKLTFFPPEDRDEKERTEREYQRASRKARRLTSLVKYLGSEKAVEMARRAIQIHGGAGYTKDYEAEKLLRDAIVFPIYEGTSQIQALFSTKDTLLGIIRRPQDFVRRAATARWRASTASGLPARVARLQGLSFAAQQHLVTRIAGGKFRELRGVPLTSWGTTLTDFDPKRDFAPALLHAERLTQILIDVAVAEELLAQSEKHPERAEVLERWLERAEPRSRHLHDVITKTGDRLLARLAEQEEAEGAVAEAAK
ncbi:MAG: acyl-CoA dehydrogenase family protein [Alphaproteobacteria bacterium]|nr:acyl-CoA dehydrogenase family protein [Alphaproteobacteria bacterium]